MGIDPNRLDELNQALGSEWDHTHQSRGHLADPAMVGTIAYHEDQSRGLHMDFADPAVTTRVKNQISGIR
ncbi:MAG: hypothetical protein RLZZ70_468 [Candidatus Parcubacteria bacterium]|jgi:hypothetical protein